MKPRIEKPYTRQRLGLHNLKFDDAIQSRVSMNADYLDRYAEIYADGREMDPIDVFFDGSVYWVANGWHRSTSARRAGKLDIAANVYEGTRDDAIEFSAGCNHEMCAPRSEADKRKAAFMLFGIPGWLEKSPVLIAEYLGVSPHLARRFKHLYASETGIELPQEVVTKSGMIHKITPRGESSTEFNKFAYAVAKRPREGLSGPLLESVSKIDSLSIDALLDYFGSRGLSFEAVHLWSHANLGRQALDGHDCVCVPAWFSTLDSLYLAHGRARILGVAREARRRIVLCYLSGDHAVLADVAKKDNVEYLTPEQAADSILLAKSKTA